MSAASKVFAIVELAEMILDQLGTCDLLLLCRVDRNMRNMIENSITLRRRIFLAPIAPTSADPKRNPVLHLLEDLLNNTIHQGPQKSALPPLPKHWRDSKAIWRRMSVSQPCTSRSFSVSIGGQMIVRDVIADKTGLTLQHIWASLGNNGSARVRARKTIMSLTKGGKSSRLKIQIEGDEMWGEVASLG